MKKIFGTFLVLCFGLTAAAQQMNKADEAVVDQIREANAAYRNIVSKFRQQKHISILDEKVVSAGDFYYDKPGRLSMRYTNPAGDLMLINGERFVMIAAGKRSETTAKASAKMRGMRTILSACLSGDLKQMGAAKITCEKNSNYHVVTAEIDAKVNKSNICRVVASYDLANKTIAILRTEEPDGSFTLYELTGKKFNQPLDDAVYETAL